MGTNISTELKRRLFGVACTSLGFCNVFYGSLMHGLYPLVMGGLCNLSTIMFKPTQKLLMMKPNKKGDKKKRKELSDQLEEDTSRWSKHLPQEILELILTRLCLNDYLSIRIVCSSWQCTVDRVIKEKRCPPAPQPPLLLMFSAIPHLNPIFVDHTLFHLWCDDGVKVSRSCHENLSRQLCCGSIEGWLIITDDFEWRPEGLFSDFLSLSSPPSLFRWFRFEKIKNFFFNPVSRAKVMLPSQLTIPCFGSSYTLFFHMAVASSVPNSPNCIVAALSSYGDLVFCRPNDKKWTFLYNSDIGEFKFVRIAIHGGKLYAMTSNAHVLLTVFDLLGDSKAKVLEILHPQGLVSDSVTMMQPQVFGGTYVSYFLKVVDIPYPEILFIARIADYALRDDSFIQNDFTYPPKTKSFQVFKMDLSGPGSSWVQLDTLGDRTLFISELSCTCISASSMGDYWKKELIRGNCIYFAFDTTSRESASRGRDVGVFSLADGSIKSNIIPEISRSWTTRWPLWFSPNPW